MQGALLKARQGLNWSHCILILILILISLHPFFMINMTQTIASWRWGQSAMLHREEFSVGSDRNWLLVATLSFENLDCPPSPNCQ